MAWQDSGRDARATDGSMGIPLSMLIDGLPIDGATHRAIDSIMVRGITDDSRLVQAGRLFIARTGHRYDGARFVQDAWQRGAVAILADRASAEQILADRSNGEAVVLACDDPAALVGILAERFYGEPSRKLKLIGVTGTNGKTTTAHLIQQLLQKAGHRCGLIGTVCVDNGLAREPATLTTPSAIEISRLLHDMLDHKCTWCVMEVSSHALQQQRAAGLQFDAAVFTNLSGDHLDYHHDMEAYASAKALLFAHLRKGACAIVNADDIAYPRMVQETRARVVRCSTDDGNADYHAAIRSSTLQGSEVDLHCRSVRQQVRIPLIGAHNISNTLLAAAVCCELGMDVNAVAAGLAEVSAPPGRYEPVAASPGWPMVLVDYAHTDHALENALRGLRPLVPVGGQLHVLFGCGGDRDRTKRPRMASVALAFADQIMVTSDNPRTEDPATIIEEILRGVPRDAMSRVTVLIDRRDAIHHAVAHAGESDVLLIAGKGHEDYQIVGEQRLHFDDRETAAQAMIRPREPMVVV